MDDYREKTENFKQPERKIERKEQEERKDLEDSFRGRDIAKEPEDINKVKAAISSAQVPAKKDTKSSKAAGRKSVKVDVLLDTVRIGGKEGLVNATKKAKKELKDPYDLDDFHDAAAEEIKNKRFEE